MVMKIKNKALIVENHEMSGLKRRHVNSMTYKLRVVGMLQLYNLSRTSALNMKSIGRILWDKPGWIAKSEFLVCR